MQNKLSDGNASFNLKKDNVNERIVSKLFI